MKRRKVPEPLEGETTEEWTIRAVDIMTKNWSDETWKILGIAQDLIDLKKIRTSNKSRMDKK